MHPYSQLPHQNFWNRFVSPTSWRDLPLCSGVKFTLGKGDRIATAGSCFAQHISRYLGHAGYSTYIVEHPHPLELPELNNAESYQTFSARYGNVYSSRQALELFQQAFGQIPIIHEYAVKAGRVYDLMRPNAIPNGFSNLAEAENDRRHHLSCVKKMFETADVFVFTLGLTECWYNAQNGHTYSACPGTVHGQYNPELHYFQNLTHAMVMADMEQLLQSLRAINPAIKVILTVSPVPLVATHTQSNVLLASSYSKSVLRSVCGEVCARHDNVQYFPSYEIISHAASFGQYLESNLRGVTERGVSHVMDVFLSAFFGTEPGSSRSSEAKLPGATTADGINTATLQFLEVECEEIYNMPAQGQ